MCLSICDVVFRRDVSPPVVLLSCAVGSSCCVYKTSDLFRYTPPSVIYTVSFKTRGNPRGSLLYMPHALISPYVYLFVD